MIQGSRFAPFLFAALIGALASVGPAQAKERRPNLLVIVADDLGYSDLGAFGGEIRTPNLDKLALNGIRLAGFHTAPTCSPTRSMLLSGTDNHRAGLGTMAELIRPNQQGKPGYEGYLRGDVATLAERLGANGYRTLLSGKWHLGLTPAQDPHARGFERSFALLQGGHNHYGTDANSAADPATRGVATYREDGKAVAKLPADFYSSDYFATRLIDFLGERPAKGKAERPFFGYLAFTAPHWPLQAPSDDIARYKGRYDEGFDVLRERRWRGSASLAFWPTMSSPMSRATATAAGIRSLPTKSGSPRATWKSMPRWSTGSTRMSGAWSRRCAHRANSTIR
jgi:arylsulfatase A-like enzyme